MELDEKQSEVREEAWLAIPRDLGDRESSGSLSAGMTTLWALVLDARFVPCRTERHLTGWRLLVPAAWFRTALHELRLFEEENRNWPPPGQPAINGSGNTLATLSVLVLLATFHNLTLIDIPLAGHVPIDWVAIGNAQATGIIHGEWWRLVTALTLHADWVHLLGNLALGGVLVVHLCREVGSGLAWSLLLSSGILGNLVNAFLQSPSHRSIGSSTAVFGVIGILAALNVIRQRQHRRRRWLLPAAAALALLALLGTEGVHTDLGAHLFGFVCGVGFGLISGQLLERYGCPGRKLNALLGLCSAMAVVVSWGAALFCQPN